MEENRLDEEELEDAGMMLSEDDILQVIELGDDQPMNGNASVSNVTNRIIMYLSM